MRFLYQNFINQSRKINWVLLVFLLLLMDVKLVVKLVAFIIIFFSRYRHISLKEIARQRLLYFYLSVIVIAVINYLLQLKQATLSSTLAVGFGICLWMICAAASYFLYKIVQKESREKLYHTITAFFILHIGTIFINLARIMIECGTINPYTYKGLNQKYYISTGDSITGITFDSPVTTAMISAFALLYFLYRRQFILSIAAMASLVIIASNLTNIFLLLVLLFVFVFKSDRLQKSFIVIQAGLFILFITKISPQNNEYLGRFTYKMLGWTYDLPKKDQSLQALKKMPDSLLDQSEKRKKIAALYIDSISAERPRHAFSSRQEKNNGFIHAANISLSENSMNKNDPFYQYRESETVLNKMNDYAHFLEKEYLPAEKDSLQKLYDWSQPGKWIAFQQMLHFLKMYPSKLLLGAGTGNFSSRVAYKTSGLGMAGAYPQKFRHIYPSFFYNHLYLYAFYHAQEQNKHAAENTPDSTYNQLLSEYGVIGLTALMLLYLGYFFRRIKKLTFGLPVLLVMSAAFFTEYWFDQLSIVILFELLLFIDIKPSTQPVQREGQSS